MWEGPGQGKNALALLSTGELGQHGKLKKEIGASWMSSKQENFLLPKEVTSKRLEANKIVVYKGVCFLKN